MNLLLKNSSGMALIPMDTRLLMDRVILLNGEIRAETADEFAKEMIYLAREDREKPVTVLIDSIGGEINAGMLIYDAIHTSGLQVRTICTGKAYSMAAVVLACGNHGRYILPHSEVLIHEPLLGNQISGSTSSLKSISDKLTDVKKQINRILALHTGKTEEEVDQATGYDHYLTAEESVAFGLCDKVTDFDVIWKE